jgi:hypothetical protein
LVCTPQKEKEKALRKWRHGKRKTKIRTEGRKGETGDKKETTKELKTRKERRGKKIRKERRTKVIAFLTCFSISSAPSLRISSSSAAALSAALLLHALRRSSISAAAAATSAAARASASTLACAGGGSHAQGSGGVPPKERLLCVCVSLMVDSKYWSSPDFSPLDVSIALPILIGRIRNQDFRSSWPSHQAFCLL